MDIPELIQKQNVRIKIIGDSIAAGAGSTGGYKTEQYILNYLKDHHQKIEDIIYNPDGVGDGLHPGDFVQKLMCEKL